MEPIKVFCSHCGQRVSGDETFYGTTVTCPVCQAAIQFPARPGDGNHEPGVPAPPVAGPLSAQNLPAPREADDSSLGSTLPPGPVQSVDRPVPAAGGESGEPEEEGTLPIIVLIAGIASLALCPLSLLIAPIAIVAGHLSLMQMHGTKAPGKNKVVIGTALGYVSLLVFLILVVLFKVFRPALERQFGGNGAA